MTQIARPAPPAGPITVAEFRAVFSDTVGGPDKTIFNSAARHNPDRVTILPLYLVPKGDPVPALHRLAEETGVSPVIVADRDRLGRRALSRLADHILERGCRILHTHDFKSDFLGLQLVRRIPGLALMATAHGWSRPQEPRLWFYNRVDRWVLRRYPLVVAVSEATAGLLRSHGIRSDRIEVLHNGVDLDRWRPSDTARGRDGDGWVIGMVARLSADKDVPTLLAAFDRIAKDFPDASLVIVGDGPERKSLERAADSLRCRSRIQFLGHRSDTLDLYRGFDISVLSSRAEGLPNSVLEAMGTARPIVATRVGGVSELVRHDREALLVRPGDPEALASALEDLLRDPLKASRLGSAARSRAEAEFSFEERVRRIESLYERHLGKTPGRLAC